MFETQVLPVAERYARRVFGRDDEKVAVALVLAWWVWSNRRTDAAPAVYARLAVRQARAGRDLPGVMPSHADDAWRHREPHPAGSLAGVADPRPGPVARLIAREDLDRLRAETTGTRRRVLDMLAGGGRTQDVAAAAGLSPARVSQIRQELRDLTD